MPFLEKHNLCWINVRLVFHGRWFGHGCFNRQLAVAILGAAATLRAVITICYFEILLTDQIVWRKYGRPDWVVLLNSAFEIASISLIRKCVLQPATDTILQS